MSDWMETVEQRRLLDEKLEAAKKRLGEKYLLHPANRVKRKTPWQPRRTNVWW